MSESTIARWNAIPLDRADDQLTLKRSRPEEEDDVEDDISIASRTPSPSLMDVDGENMLKYDEYIRGAAREVITVETKIKPTNKGFAMLAKMGWVEGQPVGLSEIGRVDPVPFHLKLDSTGLGKTNQDVRMIETTVSQRRGMDSERQQKETEEQRRAREDLVAKKSALENEISTTLKAFYCNLCDKQFKTVAQYDEHTNSYAHHHKARFREMQANVRLKPKEEVDKLKEKERKREEKELRKIAKANGIKMPKSVATSAATAFIVGEPASSSSGTMDIDPPEPKKAGWASLSSQGTDYSGSTSGFRKSNWATVGSTPPPSDPPKAPVPPATPSVATLAPAQNTSAPAFRNAGWTSLDTGSENAAPLPLSSPNSPLSLPQHAKGGWPSNNGESRSMSSGWSHSPTPTPPLSSFSQPPPPPPSPSVTTAIAEPVRSSWQQFKKSGPKRK